MNQIDVPADAFQGDLDLGVFLGRNQASGWWPGSAVVSQSVRMAEQGAIDSAMVGG
jgi:hypothetical protein